MKHSNAYRFRRAVIVIEENLATTADFRLRLHDVSLAITKWFPVSFAHTVFCGGRAMLGPIFALGDLSSFTPPSGHLEPGFDLAGGLDIAHRQIPPVASGIQGLIVVLSKFPATNLPSLTASIARAPENTFRGLAVLQGGDGALALSLAELPNTSVMGVSLTSLNPFGGSFNYWVV